MHLLNLLQETADYSDSYVSLTLEDQKEISSEYDNDVKWTAASLYTGGTDTVRLVVECILNVMTDGYSLQTIAGLTAFFLLMCLHPLPYALI